MKSPNCSNPLFRLPTEIPFRCFSSYSSFWDVLHLAATSRRHHKIWMDNVSTIYNYVNPRCIERRRYARTLLADQRGTPANSSSLTVRDILQLVRNTVIPEASVDNFNKTWVTQLVETRRTPLATTSTSMASHVLHT